MCRISLVAKWAMQWQKRQLQLGAETVLISGPVGLAKPAGMTVIDVESAADMLEAVRAQFDDASNRC